MTHEEVIEWLTSIAEKYIHGGDSRFDARRLEAINTAIEALKNDETAVLRRYHAWLLEQFHKNLTSENLHSIDTAIGWLKLYAEYKDVNVNFGV